MPSPRQLRGGFPEYSYKAEGSGLRKGVLIVIGADNTHGKIASAIGQGKYRGIQVDEGTLPDGTASSTLPDSVTAQKAGVAAALVPGSSSASEGDQAWSNASGMLVKRTPYSFSGFLLGQFDEGFTAGSAAEYRGVELFPQYMELVRQVTVSQPLKTTVLGAATVFGATTGTAFGSAAIQLYRARFTGEVVRNLSVSLGIAPGGADTVVATVQKSSDGGNTWSDTALTCTISAAGVSATDLVNAVSLTAGDILAIKFASSAGTAAGCCATFDVT